MVSFVRTSLGLIYLGLFVVFILWFFDIPVKSHDGFMGVYGAVASNIVLVIVLFFLMMGFFLKKRWVVSLYWACCLPWNVLLGSIVFDSPDIFSSFRTPVQAIECIVLLFGPTLVGVYLWRHLDHFDTGFMPRFLLSDKKKSAVNTR